MEALFALVVRLAGFDRNPTYKRVVSDMVHIRNFEKLFKIAHPVTFL